ncbi:MAG: BrnT family toxin [Phaeodactylibacter xiamenensis]|uniref:BrnT family toxin n=1 Tax=Phaeodactylibacter xiamenensis TaxID=1524460 RepID=UPI0006960851|nr:BrnT family toxin [Phaeodactylibacter xiamenensis]MCR9053529.1 BrnT family toxin [bacterium]
MKAFEWDENKNRKNQQKHNLSFEQASGVFEDENRLQYAVESKDEIRYITIGKVLKVIITVVYTIRDFAFFIAVHFYFTGSSLKIGKKDLKHA